MLLFNNIVPLVILTFLILIINQQQDVEAMQRLDLHHNPQSARTLDNLIKSVASTRRRYSQNRRFPSIYELLSVGAANPSNISLVNVDNIYYTGQVTLGTPPQNLTVLLTTSYSDLWVVSAKSPTISASSGTYNSTASSTYVKNGTAFSITYSDGSKNSGFLSVDTLGIGGISVLSQTFAEITSLSSVDAAQVYDGILGLAYPSTSISGATPPFQNMINQSLVSPSVFSLWLSSYKSAGATAGELTFGGQNPNHYKGSIKWVPVNTTQGLWQFKVDSVEVCVTIFSNQICLGRQMLCRGGCQMIADSGTTLIYGPTKAINKINRLIGSFFTTQGVSLINCNATANAPNITFTIGGTPFTMTSSQYIVPMIGTTTCASAFSPGLSASSTWILGDPFFRQFYMSFDYGNNRIGFATAA